MRCGGRSGPDQRCDGDRETRREEKRDTKKRRTRRRKGHGYPPAARQPGGQAVQPASQGVGEAGGGGGWGRAGEWSGGERH